ncbi:MAG TPA: PilZ domain-containing protein [Polyangia bacterium]
MNRRTNVRAKVDLLANRFLDGRPYVCRVTDLSLTGLRLQPLLEPLTPGRFMGLQLELPDTGAIVTASAEIVEGAGTRDGAHGIGVRFTRLGPESERALRSFVEAN